MLASYCSSPSRNGRNAVVGLGWGTDQIRFGREAFQSDMIRQMGGPCSVCVEPKTSVRTKRVAVQSFIVISQHLETSWHVLGGVGLCFWSESYDFIRTRPDVDD